MKRKFKVESQWGGGGTFILLSSADISSETLTVTESRQLAYDLIEAADWCDKMNKSHEKYVKQEDRLIWVVSPKDNPKNIIERFPSYKDACDVYKDDHSVVIYNIKEMKDVAI